MDGLKYMAVYKALLPILSNPVSDLSFTPAPFPTLVLKNSSFILSSQLASNTVITLLFLSARLSALLNIAEVVNSDLKGWTQSINQPQKCSLRSTVS